MKSVAVLNN